MFFDKTNISAVTSPAPDIKTAEDAISLNTSYHVKIEFSETDYSVTINDTPVDFPSVGNLVPYYSSDAVSFDKLRFSITSSSLYGARVFVDNISLVTESGASAKLSGRFSRLYEISTTDGH